MTNSKTINVKGFDFNYGEYALFEPFIQLLDAKSENKSNTKLPVSQLNPAFVPLSGDKKVEVTNYHHLIFQIGWSHHIVLIQKVKELPTRFWYMQQTLKNGWGDGVFAEYALRDLNKPIGISEYELTQALPDNLKSSLPSIEEIENEFLKPENK